MSDSLVFSDKSTELCTMDIAKVQDVDIQTGYDHGYITIKTALGAPSTLEVMNTFRMAAGVHTIRGTPDGRSTLKLSGASLFTLSGGNVFGLDIELGSATNHDVTGKIDGTVDLSDSTLTNYGTSFTWTAGDIKSSVNEPAKIVNQAGATIEVQSTGRFYDPGNALEDAGDIENRGTLKFNTAGVRITASFWNLDGIVRVYPGQVQFDHRAVQVGGTFELRNGTVNVSNNKGDVLEIWDGTITGAGTIDGNLNLGNDGGAATAVTIKPGIEAAVGTITITKSWQMFSSSGQTWIRVLDDGSYSKIVANTGWAKLGGVLWIENSSNYKPAHQTSLDFLTAHLGFDGTNFSHKGVAYWGCWMDPGGSGKMVKWTLPTPTGNTYSLVTTLVGS